MCYEAENEQSLSSNLKEKMCAIGGKVLNVILCFILCILLSTSIFFTFTFMSWHIALNMILDKHFVEVQKAGYVTEDIKNSIMDEADDIFGLLFDYEISGTDKKVEGGEPVYLKFKLYPINPKFKKFSATFVRAGRSKRMQTQNYLSVIEGYQQ